MNSFYVSFELYDLDNSKPFFFYFSQQKLTDNYFFESPEYVSFFFKGMYVIGLLIFSFSCVWNGFFFFFYVRILQRKSGTLGCGCLLYCNKEST